MKIVNVVATARLHKSMDLNVLDGYNPKKFNGAIVKRRKATFLIFSNGKIVVNGVPTLRQVQLACNELGSELQIKIGKVTAQNIVGSGCIEPLRPADLYRWLGKKFNPSMEPELFPGICLRIGGAAVRLFRTGKYFITGVKNVHTLRAVNKDFLCIIKKFQNLSNGVKSLLA